MTVLQMIKEAALCKYYSFKDFAMRLVYRNFMARFQLGNLPRLTLPNTLMNQSWTVMRLILCLKNLKFEFAIISCQKSEEDILYHYH